MVLELRPGSGPSILYPSGYCMFMFPGTRDACGYNVVQAIPKNLDIFLIYLLQMQKVDNKIDLVKTLTKSDNNITR